MLLFLMSQGSLNLKIRFLDQKVCSVALGHKCIQRTPFQGFRNFSPPPVIKDRSNIKMYMYSVWPNESIPHPFVGAKHNIDRIPPPWVCK